MDTDRTGKRWAGEAVSLTPQVSLEGQSADMDRSRGGDGDPTLAFEWGLISGGPKKSSRNKMDAKTTSKYLGTLAAMDELQNHSIRCSVRKIGPQQAQTLPSKTTFKLTLAKQKWKQRMADRHSVKKSRRLRITSREASKEGRRQMKPQSWSRCEA